MINVIINSELEIKILRELKSLIKDKGYLLYASVSNQEISVYHDYTFFKPMRTYLSIITKDKFQDINSNIIIKTYGSAVLGNTVANLFEEYGYKNITVNICSDEPQSDRHIS